MALAPDPRPLTAEEYARLPEGDGVRHELAAVYRSLLDRRRLEEGETLDGGEVPPGLTIALADLFRP